jgi:hypothetical protein
MDGKAPAVFTLEAQPDWGFGVLIEEREGKLVLLFESGGRRVFDKLKVKGLHPAIASPEDARALEAKLRGRRLPAGEKAAKPKAKRVSTHAPAHASFEEQLRWFEKNFPEGFEGERFITEERGKPGSKVKGGNKGAALALARELLSPERFTSAPAEELFESARKLLQATNIVHPLEGPATFGSMAAEARAPFLAALRELLHGTGDYGPRFERFLESLRIPDAEGKAKRVTWPMATLFSAMYHPTEHVCVKPTCFEAQAPLVGLSIEKSQPPSAAGYERLLEVARATQQRLLAAGHRPRDLMDVYSFIWRSQSAKAPA